MQHRKSDNLTFAHTIFKDTDSSKHIYLLVVTLNSKNVVLASDTYTMNEIVDKVKVIANNISVAKEGVYEMALL